jgi:ABC-2 type transport system permease protein
MRKTLILARVLIKNAQNPIAAGGHKRIKNILFWTLVCFVFFPIMVQIGLLASKILGILVPLGQEGMVLAFGFSSASLLIFVFGIFSVLSVFYFSQDVQFLLAMPLKPSEILAAKFLTSMVVEYAAESLFLLPLFVVFGFHSHPSPFYAAVALCVFLLLPVIPVVMASILVMVMMLFTDASKNRDRFIKIAGSVMLILVLGMNYFLQKNTGAAMNPERFSKVMTDGSNLWTSAVNRLFPAGKLAVIAVLKNGQTAGFISLLLFLSASALAFFILIVLGEKLYLRGIFGKPSGIFRIRAPERLNLSETARADSAFKTYLMKDLRILFRDPVFFMNCILTNFFLPVLIVFFSSVGGGESKGQITALLARASGGGIFYAAGLGFCILLTSMNAIASSAISREGKNLSVAKYLPVSYQKQILAKAAAGAAMGCAGCLLMILAAVFWFHVPVRLMPPLLALIPIGTAFASFSGILIDLYFPKLTWDNAYKAVKQNMNVLIHMAVCALVAGFTIGVVLIFRWPQAHALRILILIFSLIDFALYRFLMTRGAKIFSEIEV